MVSVFFGGMAEDQGWSAQIGFTDTLLVDSDVITNADNDTGDYLDSSSIGMNVKIQRYENDLFAFGIGYNSISFDSDGVVLNQSITDLDVSAMYISAEFRGGKTFEGYGSIELGQSDIDSVDLTQPGFLPEKLYKGTKDRIIAEQRIADLEYQLEEAEAKEERAKSMAQQTRKGHVYIISNIGSFGDKIYKIGLTRRLDPMDRVKELGDASVPFTFDVHAMIYVDDAPALERELHKTFTHKRVNAINHRKEFFNVDLNEIIEAAEKITNKELEFTKTIVAEQYFESKRMRGEEV